MIEAVYAIGRATFPAPAPATLFPTLTEDERRELAVLVEPPPARRILALVFPDDTSTVTIRLEEVAREAPFRYLYRSGPGGGPLNLPYGVLTFRSQETEEATIRRVLANRFRSWAASLPDTAVSTPRLQILRETFGSADRLDRLVGPLVAAVQRLSPTQRREGVLVTPAFATASGVLHLGEAGPEFARLFLETQRRRLLGPCPPEGLCALCPTPRPTAVSGRLASDVFPFATADKPGYVVGGLRPELAWRTFPLCYPCYLILAHGRRVVEERCALRFAGLTVWRIPVALSDDMLRDMLALLPAPARRLTVGPRTRRLLEPQEDEVLWRLSQGSDLGYVHLVGLEARQGREQVRLLVTDLFPSWLRRVFAATDRVVRQAEGVGLIPDRRFVLDEALFRLFGVEEDDPDGRQRAVVRQDTARDDRDTPRRTARREGALRVLEACLCGQPVDPADLWPVILAALRPVVIARYTRRPSPPPPPRLAEDAWLTIAFLADLGLWPVKGGGTVIDEGTEPIWTADPFFQALDAFFAQHPAMFATATARGLFTLGGLVGMLLSLQRDQLGGATPFFGELRGLRLDRRDFLGLLPKVRLKLQQYRAWHGPFARVGRAAMVYLAHSEHVPWPMSLEEMNALFVMGMELQRLFWTLYKRTCAEEEKIHDHPAEV
jgi:CRISPR-associated protein Csh1